jgi:hypothetical protein
MHFSERYGFCAFETGQTIKTLREWRSKLFLRFSQIGIKEAGKRYIDGPGKRFKYAPNVTVRLGARLKNRSADAADKFARM